MAEFINGNTAVVPGFVDRSHPGAKVYEDAAAAILNAGLNVVRMDMPGYCLCELPGDSSRGSVVHAV